jgi:hypothetical protein
MKNPHLKFYRIDSLFITYTTIHTQLYPSQNVPKL